jgi:hypothetical protein
MDMENFEQRLRRQPLRQIPGDWRREILASAERAPRPGPRASFLSTFNAQISAILWPHPKAWAGLAAVWILIFAVDFSMRDTTPVMTEKTAPPSPEIIVELKQQQRLLAELIGADQARDAEPPGFLPLPRSERVEILMT